MCHFKENASMKLRLSKLVQPNTASAKVAYEMMKCNKDAPAFDVPPHVVADFRIWASAYNEFDRRPMDYRRA